jgi:hypothetical protein
MRKIFVSACVRREFSMFSPYNIMNSILRLLISFPSVFISNLTLIEIHQHIFGVSKTTCNGPGVRGEATPVKVWTCPEVSSRLRLPDFKTNSI